MPLPYKTIKEAAEALRSGLTSPHELVEEAFKRIDEVDDRLEAFVTLMRDEALADADMIEREQFTGFFRSPLSGIPVAIKDLISVKGVRTTAGSKVLADYISPEDAMVVEQLRKAGAIIIGKTNTHEFAYGTYTPPTRNPWGLEHIPGGSSGGSAVALAAGMALGAIGSDTGGSIRIPSACCGVTGLKPTYGRVSCYGVIPLSWSLDHVGPMARTAEDCAILFDAIAGYDPRDPNSISGPPARSAVSLIDGPVGRNHGSLQGLTLGIPQEEFFAPLNPEVRAAWKGAILVLQEEGAEVQDVELPTATMELYRTIQGPEATLSHLEAGWLTNKKELYGEHTLQALMRGNEIPAVDYLRAQQQRRTFSSSMRSVLQNQGINALILPTISIPAPLRSQDWKEVEIDEGIMQTTGTALLRLNMPFNLSGLPSISFPCGFNQEGLPLAVQVAGRPFEEATVLRIAHAYQRLTDWHSKEPAI